MRNITPNSESALKCLASTTGCENLEMAFETINEQELADNLESKAVKGLYLIQGSDDQFRVYAELTWKEGLQLLETQRKKPKEWASLDRLVRHINTKYKYVPIIQMEVRSHNEKEISRIVQKNNHP